MNAAIAKTLYHITHQQNIDEVSTGELTQLAEAYPYFAAVQVLLAAKLKKENNYQAANQLQKAVLFGNNPMWLEHGLFNGEAKDINIIHTEKLPQYTVENYNTPPVAEIVKEEEIITPPAEDIYKAQVPFPSSFNIPTVENVKETLYSIDKKEEQPLAPSSVETPVQQGFSSIVPTAPTAPTAPASTGSMPSYSSFFQNKPDDVPEEAEMSEEDELHNRPDTIAPFEDKQAEKLSSVLSNSFSDYNKPVAADDKLEYESNQSFTVDYFASQGIKADLTKQPQDKLTLQLLKFTDWLKVIKKTTPNPTDLGTDPELENAIKGIAQTSNESREIVTETMADVFVKQGKIDKAVQLYIKLSFLEPEKSSYFAAKIQELKGI